MATVKGKPAAKAATKASDGIQAYCMKTKQKENVDNAVIEKTDRGQYIVKGTATKDKHKVSVIVSEATANELVKSKAAKKGW